MKCWLVVLYSSDKGTEDAVGDARTSIPGTFQKNPPVSDWNTKERKKSRERIGKSTDFKYLS